MELSTAKGTHNTGIQASEEGADPSLGFGESTLSVQVQVRWEE